MNYADKMRQAITDNTFRLLINLNDLRNFDENVAQIIPFNINLRINFINVVKLYMYIVYCVYSLLRNPREYVVALQQVVTEIATTVDPSTAKLLQSREIQIKFDGSFGANSVSPRGLLSSQLNRFVEVELFTVNSICSGINRYL